jgi:hypothetical protein
MDGWTDLLGLLVKLREHCSFSFGPTLHFGLRNVCHMFLLGMMNSL